MANSGPLYRYLNDKEGPRPIGVLDPIVEGRATAVSIPVRQSREKPSISTRTSFGSSQVSDSTSQYQSILSTSDSSSHRSSVLSRQDSSSTWSSVSEGPPEETVDQHISNMDSQGPYVCMMNFIGCRSSFALDNFDSWYEHNLLHFRGRPFPAWTRCIFCEEVFENGTPEECWQQRMRHIAEHFDRGYNFETHARPDFALINHLREVELIDSILYENLKKGDQRPDLEGFCSYDHIPQQIGDQETKRRYRDNLVPVKENRMSARSQLERNRRRRK